MRTDVSIRHEDDSARLRAYVSSRLSRLATIFDNTLSVRAIMDRERNQHRVELVSSVGHGQVLVVEARGESMGSALSEALDRMRSVLGKHKEKRLTRRR